MTWPTLLLLISGFVMMLAGITILLRAAGIDDDWDPFR